MNKKILVVCRNFWPEEVRINTVCACLREKGFSTDVLCGQPSGRDGEFLKGYDSFRVRRESHEKADIYRTVDVKKGNGSNIRLFLYYMAFPVFGRALCKKLETKKYDAVLIWQMSPVMMASPGIRIAQRLGIPVYLYVEDLWPEALFDVLEVRSGLFRKFLFKLSDHYYNKVSSLIVSSERMKKYLSDRLGRAGSDFFVVPGFCSDRFGTAKNDDTIQEMLVGSFSLVIFEDENEKMDCDCIIKAAMLIRSHSLRNIRFVAVGDGRDIRRLSAMVEKNDLHEYFFFVGSVADEDAGVFVNVADALMHIIIPAHTGEFETPELLTDLFAAGKPLIITDQGEARETVLNAGCGIVANALDADNLFNSIVKLYSMSPGERMKMGSNAFLCCEELFDPSKNADLLADILNGTAADETEDASGIRKLW